MSKKLYYANPNTKKWEEVDESVDLRTMRGKVVKCQDSYQAPLSTTKAPYYLDPRAKRIEATNLETLQKFIIHGPHHLADLGFSHGCVSRCCNGKTPAHKNHTFKYV